MHYLLALCRSGIPLSRARQRRHGEGGAGNGGHLGGDTVGIATARRVPVWPRGDAGLPAFVAALLDAPGTALYLFSVHLGPLALVAVLTSLYPASTVLLARAILGERLSRARVAGLACALLAIAMILMG